MSKVRLYGGTSGFVELAAPDVSDDGVLTLPTAAQGILAASGGIGTNVVGVNLAGSTSFATSSTTFVDITDLTVTITPSSATSKILVLGNVPESNQSAGGNANIIQLFRGATALEQRAVVLQTASGGAGMGLGALANLDSPGVASATTYTVRARVNGGTGTFFGGWLIAIEVKA